MKDKEKYAGLRKSLDSLRDVALVEIELIEGESKKAEFVDFMTEKVKGWLKEIALVRGKAWKEMKKAQSEKFQRHAATLLSNPSSDCPPGFIEVDGICVRL